MDELRFRLAARRGLVVVKRGIGTKGLTPELLAREFPPEDLAFMVLTGSDDWGSTVEMCLRLGSEDELTPDDLVLYNWFPEENGLAGGLLFIRLVPKDELTPEQLPFVEGFVFQAHSPPWEPFVVEPTDRIKFAADVIEDADKA